MSNRNEKLPQAVSNLRKIWDKKKAEMRFTQVEASKKLGWTQGAISHYLNDITHLGPAAVIKFANFLGVDPIDIDPTIKEHLPHVKKMVVKYEGSNLTKEVNKHIYLKDSPNSFWIDIDPTTLRQHEKLVLNPAFQAAAAAGVMVAQLCPVEEAPDSKIRFVLVKGETIGMFFGKDFVPPKRTIKKDYSVLEIGLVLHQE